MKEKNGGIRMKRRIQEWISVMLVRHPGRMVLVAILLFNVLLFLVSAGVISALSLEGTEHMGFIEAAFCTVTMILDAGCIQFVVSDIGKSGVAITVFCLVVIMVGMVSFTGAVIGYITNYISHFIENSNSGVRKLKLYDHVVILNWNTRASEIVNDLLYCEERQKVVVLVGSRKDEVEKEIHERLSDTVARENLAMQKKYAHLPFFSRWLAYRRNKFKKNVTVLVREGDVFSSMQLNDISVKRAKSVIILGNDVNNTVCKFEHKELQELLSRGNSHTVKTLMQVADMTSAADSNDQQKIIVEITDDWTWELVDKIKQYKQVDAKCNIVPVRVNKILGQILSQFSLMPELNMVYRELFSNKGSAFYSEEQPMEEDVPFAMQYLANHKHAIPLTFMEKGGKTHCYYAAEHAKDIGKRTEVQGVAGYTVKLNQNYWMERKNVVILGHNSKSRDIMQGFAAFGDEWNRDGEIVRIIVIDDEKSLEKMNHYADYPFVVQTVAAEIYDKDLICRTIEEFVSQNETDTSVLILSDDAALNEDIDAGALANLIYVQEIINRKKKEEPDFDPESIDVVVEIIDPKHHDIVSSYSVNNVVISNRYISKMITQISEKEALFDFYSDILTYDTGDSEQYDSKEIYVKKMSRFFDELPGECTADQLIRAVLEATKEKNPAMVLGYVKPGGRMVLFGGDQSAIRVCPEPRDKIILFSNH